MVLKMVRTEPIVTTSVAGLEVPCTFLLISLDAPCFGFFKSSKRINKYSLRVGSISHRVNLKGRSKHKASKR